MSMFELDDWNPTEEILRQWAGDDELLLSGQDEDLVLHRAVYVPLLLEFASDPACVKQEYCLEILAFFAQTALLRGATETVDGIYQACRAYTKPLAPQVSRWLTGFKELHRRLVNPRPLTEAETRQLANQLLFGPYAASKLTAIRTLSTGEAEFKTDSPSYPMYLYINPATGTWQIAYRPKETA